MDKIAGLPQFDGEDLDQRLGSIFCHALVPLLCRLFPHLT